jgi:hypothetical protein
MEYVNCQMRVQAFTSDIPDGVAAAAAREENVA